MGNNYPRVVEGVAAGIAFAIPLVLVGLAGGAYRIFCSPRRDLSFGGLRGARCGLRQTGDAAQVDVTSRRTCAQVRRDVTQRAPRSPTKDRSCRGEQNIL